MGGPESQHNGLDRRTFLKGAGITAIGAAAMGALTGCGNGYTVPAGEEPVNASAGQVPGTPSWLGQAPEVAERDITETIDTEVLVVGCRTAGLPAVISAAENGAKVLGIDRQGTPITSARTSAPSIRACNRPPSTSSRSSASRRKRPSRTSSATPTAL